MSETIDGAPVAVPRRNRHRLRYVVLGLVCIAAISWMLVLMQRNVVFFKTVSEAVADREADGTRQMRKRVVALAGAWIREIEPAVEQTERRLAQPLGQRFR